MTEKDLMRGLNEIDDDLIEEAAAYGAKRGRRRRLLRFPAAAAAVLVLGVGLYAAVGGPSRRPETGVTALTGREETGAQETLPEESAAALQGLAAAKEEAAENPEEDLAEEDLAEAVPEELPEVPPAPLESETLPVYSETAGVPVEEVLGEDYRAAADYGEIYDAVKNHEEVLYSIAMDGGELLEYAVAENEDVMAGAAEEAAPAAAGGFSVTNVMTAGIDEADLVKTDGAYIYAAAGRSVVITDIREGRPGEQITLSMPEEAAMDTLAELYVEEGRLTVIGWKLEERDAFRTLEDAGEDLAVPKPEQVRTVAAVFSTEDPMQPAYAGCMVQDGYYQTSRKVGDVLYLFTECGVFAPEIDRTEALLKERAADWIPCVNGRPLAPDRIYLTEDCSRGILAASAALSDPAQELDARFLFTDSAEVYVSASALYLYYERWLKESGYTRILKLSCRDGEISPVASGRVQGSVTDRFALNEKDGFLRVLTTDYYSGGQTTNMLVILDEHLQETGRLEGIAPGEVIYAARFVGNLAWFVTYRNTDPLFAADLSDPASPKLLGELSITGFSQYLHLWDDTHMLGIGYETDPETGSFLGVKLTMFDISDPAAPAAEYTKVLEGDSGSSAIDWNYKAILADPGKNLIGVMTWREKEDGIYPAYSVFSYSGEEGFSTKLRCVGENYESFSEECRGLYAGETFYLADGSLVRAWRMTEAGEGWEELAAAGE